MKNWYKQSQSINMMSFISQWIIASYHTPQDPNQFIEQAKSYTGGMIDPSDMRSSIGLAREQVSSRQRGEITEFQEQFIQSILSTILSDPSPDIAIDNNEFELENDPGTMMENPLD